MYTAGRVIIALYSILADSSAIYVCIGIMWYIMWMRKVIRVAKIKNIKKGLSMHIFAFFFDPIPPSSYYYSGSHFSLSTKVWYKVTNFWPWKPTSSELSRSEAGHGEPDVVRPLQPLLAGQWGRRKVSLWTRSLIFYNIIIASYFTVIILVEYDYNLTVKKPSKMKKIQWSKFRSYNTIDLNVWKSDWNYLLKQL